MFSGPQRGEIGCIFKLIVRPIQTIQLPILILAIALSGCAYVNPVVDVVKRSAPTNNDKNTMPVLAASIESTDEVIAILENKRNDTLYTGRILDFVTFGSGAGAAGYALSGGHTMAVRNLTFGAGASYAGSTLFASTDVALIYNAGVSALSCVSGKAAALRGTAIRYKPQLEANLVDSQLDSLTPSDCTPSPELKKQLDSAYAVADKTKLTLTAVLAADQDEAQRLLSATNNVILAVNQQVLAHANSPEAILAAAKGLAPHAIGTSTASKATAPAPLALPAPAGKFGGYAKPKPLPACTKENTDQYSGLASQFISNYTAIDAALSAAMNSMSALDTGCSFTAPATVDLTLSQDTVDIGKDMRFNVIVAGGHPPYSLVSVGDESMDMDVQLIAPNTITITGKSTIASDKGPYLFNVKDSSIIANLKQLKVSTKVPK